MPNQKQTIGALGEDTAKAYLLGKGWKFLASRYFTRLGELDLVMKEGDTLVFVEVKARRKANQFETAITIKKAQHLYKAAAIYIDKIKPEFKETRFDAVYITINSRGEVEEIGHRPNFF